jgi:5'-methylthioadenosine phosphorylase
MRIGIIGGSGVYHMEGLEDVREELVDTPFGAPSDALIHGKLRGAELVFLPRHGRGHRFNPSEVYYRAHN